MKKFSMFIGDALHKHPRHIADDISDLKIITIW